MKKSVFAFFAASLCLAACQIEIVDPNQPNVSDDVLSAKIEQNEVTKTVLGESNNVFWSENDQIVAFMKSSYGHKYQIKSSFAGKTYADFSRVSSASGDDLSAGMEWDHNVAYYPYSESIECVKSGDNYALDVVLPTEQNYAANSFGNGSFPMVAVSEDNNITFKNVCGGIKLQLKGTQNVKSITLQGKNNEKLSGPAIVTAYTNSETKPAITMTGTDAASKSVTLNCGEGVQLIESNATEFIIALPPVLFSNGFIVTVTDSESQPYTIETDKVNTVLRSSLLLMPAVTLTASGGGDSEEDDDATYIEYVFLSESSLTMMPNTSYTLVAEIDPVDVTYPTLTWSSSDNSVAEVDQNGKVTARSDGYVTITALAVGGVSESCSVTVKTPKTFAPGDYVDYVDELGVNHGKGVDVAGVIWAPVNCGYEAATADYKGYPYGKLYQWGRKHGQGYDSSDASYPSGENLVEGPVRPSLGSSDTYKDAFFKVDGLGGDWCDTQIDDLWVDSEGNKTKKDPCPTGWRVPTYDELAVLCDNFSSWTTNSEGQNGYYFVGEYTYIDGLPQVFFPAAGSRDYSVGDVYDRGYYGFYWSSRPDDYDAYRANTLYFFGGNFYGGGVDMDAFARACGFSVRCVQE